MVCLIMKKKQKKRYNELYSKSGWRINENEHLYLCYECIEKALGRKIKRNDLIGKNVPFNENFEEMYFSK